MVLNAKNFAFSTSNASALGEYILKPVTLYPPIKTYHFNISLNNQIDLPHTCAPIKEVDGALPKCRKAI